MGLRELCMAGYAVMTGESGGFAARRLQDWVTGASGREPPNPAIERLRAFREDACGAWPRVGGPETPPVEAVSADRAA